MKKYNVAVVGATGAVGAEILEVLSERNFPINKLVPLASARSAGKTVNYKKEEVIIKELTETVFKEEEIEIALFSAGGSISAEFAPHAAKAGAVVIDNTSHFRMEEDVPLVVPEVNPQDIKDWKKTGIIANPNCSTIQMVIALKPLDERFKIKRVDVSTYQAVSGSGAKAMEELMGQMRDVMNFEFDQSVPEVYPYKICLNAIPHIDKFMESGFTKEEEKMIYETQKILHKELQVAAHCVRIPVLRGHSESITITFEEEVEADIAREILENTESVIVQDDVESLVYPMPQESAGKDEVFIGRMKNDIYDKKILHLWCVADNLRVGAATNAVRIAQKWVELEG